MRPMLLQYYEAATATIRRYSLRAAHSPLLTAGGVRHHPLPPARRRGRVLRAVLVRLLGVGRPAARAALLQRRHRLPHVHGLRRLRRRLARLDGGGRGARVRVPADAARVPPPGGGWRVGARGGPVGPKGEAGVRGRAAHLVQLLARLVLLDVCHGRGRGREQPRAAESSRETAERSRDRGWRRGRGQCSGQACSGVANGVSSRRLA